MLLLTNSSVGTGLMPIGNDDERVGSILEERALISTYKSRQGMWVCTYLYTIPELGLTKSTNSKARPFALRKTWYSKDEDTSKKNYSTSVNGTVCAPRLINLGRDHLSRNDVEYT